MRVRKVFLSEGNLEYRYETEVLHQLKSYFLVDLASKKVLTYQNPRDGD